MVDWINANTGVLVLVSAVVTPVVVALINLWGTRRDKAAANAITAVNAANTHLTALLEDSRQRESSAKAAEGAAQRKCEMLEKDAGIVRHKVENLQSEISTLRQRPCLAREKHHYIYAFPEPGQHDTAFCQECWDNDRKLTILEFDKSAQPYEWHCSIHRKTLCKKGRPSARRDSPARQREQSAKTAIKKFWRK